MSKTPRNKVADIIADTTLKNGVSKAYSREIAAYLLTEGRVRELDSVLRDIQADWAELGYLEVLASSAFPLSSAVHVDITRRVKQLHPEAKKIIITEVHDPDVIGGVRLSLPNEQLDLSIQAKLNKFKQLTATGRN